MLYVGWKLLDAVGGNPLDRAWLKTSLCVGWEPLDDRVGWEPHYSPAVSLSTNSSGVYVGWVSGVEDFNSTRKIDLTISLRVSSTALVRH